MQLLWAVVTIYSKMLNMELTMTLIVLMEFAHTLDIPEL